MREPIWVAQKAELRIAPRRPHVSGCLQDRSLFRHARLVSRYEKVQAFIGCVARALLWLDRYLDQWCICSQILQVAHWLGA